MTPEKIPIRPLGGPPPGGAYSPGLRAGDFVFVSGQGPRDAEGKVAGEGVEEQTELTLANLARVLEAGGASLRDVVSIKVHLENLDDFAAFDRAYRALMPEPYPVRTTVGSRLRNMLVEIDAIAYAPRRSDTDPRSEPA